MGGEYEQGGEPAGVDLDRLLAEIDNSMAHAPSADTTTPQDHWSDALTEVPEPEEQDDEDPYAYLPPEQSALNFGMKEDSHAGERAAALPGSTADQKGEEVMSRGVLMGAAALGALGILSGAAGLFMAVSASRQIEALQQSLDGLQGRLATMQVSGDPRVGQLQAEQTGITSRLDELASRLEGLAAPAVPTTAELDKRLDALERKAAQPVKVAATTQRATTTAKTSKAASGSGGWSVILVSFPSSAQAESEKGRLQKLGIPGEVIKSQIDGKSWYRVSVPGYGSHDSAKAAIPGLESKSGINGAWVAQR